jgi:hypothetical protein
MRRTWLLVLLAAAACSPRRRAFPLGLVEPVTPRAAAAARAMGLLVAPQAPAGAATLSAAVALKGGGEITADFSRLRFLTGRALAEGATGLFLRLPATPAGRDYADYGEEGQAVERVFRELSSLRPALEGGVDAPAPFVVPPGVEARAWSFQGRLYLLLVNTATVASPVDPESLTGWRALFSVRSDARQALTPCGPGVCLAPQSVLWLEGRLLPRLGL